MMTMRLLFAITILSFCAALWVALFLTRRIRMKQLAGARRTRRGRRWFNQEFFEAGQFRTPRVLRFEQDIRREGPRRELPQAAQGAIGFWESPRRRSSAPVSMPPATISASLDPSPAPDVKKGLVIAISGSGTAARHNPAAEHSSDRVPGGQFGPRKSPHSALPFGARRIDRSLFNRSSERGSHRSQTASLRDPYDHPLRGSGTQGPILEGQ